MSGRRRTLWALLGFIAVSTPLALAVETLLRQLLFPPEFAEVRAWLSPKLTTWVWVATPMSVVLTGVGIAYRRSAIRRGIKKLGSRAEDPKALQKLEFDALILSTSAPQVPALLATFAFMFGSALQPVIVAIAAATVGVLVVGWEGLRSSDLAASSD